MPISPIIRKPIPPSPSSSSVPSMGDQVHSLSPDPPSSSNAAEEQKLSALQERIERIREDRERLEKIQELRDLEEQTKREILEQQKRTGGI
jgi:hypothetical protein